LNKDDYNSIQSAVQGLYKEKGSKFIAYAYPFKNTSELKPYLEKLRKEHPKARHWCYAYRIGQTGESFRSNDDGEPSGSAGKPILGQLLSQSLSDTLIVVVRYFGGTKLGVPGLIHAYKAAAFDAIQNAEIIVKTKSKNFILIAPYSAMGRVMQAMKKSNIILEDKVFNEDIKLYFSIPISEIELQIQTIKAAILDRPLSDVSWDEKIDNCTIEERE